MTTRLAFQRRRVGLALGIAAGIGGCAVERMSAVELVTSDAGGPGDAGETSDVGAGSDATIDRTADSPDAGIDSFTADDGSEASPGSSPCTNPAWSTTAPLGIWPSAGYFVFNNVWDTPADPGRQTIYACSYHSWYVDSDQADDGGAVESYPNVQMNFPQNPAAGGVPISSFQTITSTFAETSPHVGIYEYAYDIWLNGVATAGDNQIMIWVDNYGRVPAGSKVMTTSIGARTYEVWTTSDGSTIALVSTSTFTSGTVDLLQIFNWALGKSLLPAGSTLNQIDFGVEIVSTGGATARFEVDDFSIDAR